MSGRSLLTAEDVAEVVREFQQENEVPTRHARTATMTARGEPVMPGGMAGALLDLDLDLDLSQIKLSPDEADDMHQQMAALTADQRGDQLQRLERGLLRLERINLQTLALLQKLVAAVKKPGVSDT